MTKPSSSKLFGLTCLVLALGTLALYWPTFHYPFINFDDNDYITNNPMVKAGLTWKGVVWAFNGIHEANWHPLTWLSLMLDYQFFGLHAGGFHFVNVLFHTANALLLFAFLRSTTGANWRSAVVAALFAWHPQHVESVAWISERKDVLSAFFWLLTMLTYARYARNPSGHGMRATNDSSIEQHRVTSHPWLWYALAVLFCACAMLSKPMAVTLPFALLLLDVWPLKRIELTAFPIRNWKRLLLEKIPFYLLCVGVCAMTVIAQHGPGAVSSVDFSSRLGNVPVAYARYLSKMFWPVDLSIIYPYVYKWPLLLITGSGVLLLLISALTVIFFKKHTWPAIGWFWFLGTLVPAIGIVQVGAQSMADRYAYIPSIGVFIVVVWGVTELCVRRTNGKFILTLIGGCAIIGYALTASVQITYWRSTESLFVHALQVTRNNYVANNALGKTLEMAGHYEQAKRFYEEAVHIQPRYAVSQFNLGILLITLGQKTEALPHLIAAAELAPNDAEAQFNLGIFYLQDQKWSKAAEYFAATIKLQPNLAVAHYRYGQALVHLEKFSAAADQFREALHLQPDNANAKKALNALLNTHPELK